MKMVALGEVAEWGSGGTPKRSIAKYFGKGTPWLSIADLNDGVIATAKESLTPAGIANSSAKIVPPGTLFIAMYGSIGKLGIAGVEMATSQAIAFAKPYEDVVDRRFLFHYLLAQRAKLQARGRGGTQMNIGQGDLKKWPIPLPPLPEQRRIAAILDKADAIRAQRRQVLAHLDSLPQAVFHEMFGTIPPSIPMSELAEGFRYGTSNKSGKSGYPALRIPNVVGGAIETSVIKTVDVESAELARLELRDGDVLFVRTNGNPDNVGRSAAFSYAAVEAAGFGDQPWIFASYLIRARFAASIVPTFVTTYLATPVGRRQLRERSKTSAGQYNINIESLSSVRIPSVSVTRQREFAVHVALARQNRTGVERALAATDALFASLQSRAFRGEL